MGYLSEHCIFAPLTQHLRDSLTGFDCQREPAIQEFFRDEAILNAEELMSKSYCFYRKDTMEAVAAFCVINTDIAIDMIPKSTRNKLNRKIPYAKQRDHYPAVLIGQNQFWPVFKTEEDERIANELEPDKPLLTRFMIADLKI